jgi:hypothetical protein
MAAKRAKEWGYQPDRRGGWSVERSDLCLHSHTDSRITKSGTRVWLGNVGAVARDDSALWKEEG